MSGYALHPQAYNDLDDIRGYIAQHNPDAAGRVITEIFDAICVLVPFPNRGHRRTGKFSRIKVRCTRRLQWPICSR
jgi:plasmid stabilization system protein ParE